MTRLLRRQPSGVKLLALLMISTLLVWLDDPYGLSAGAMISVLLWLSLGRDTDQSAPIATTGSATLWFVLMIVLLGGYSAWFSGISAAVVTMARLICLVVLALVVMRTTPVTQMMAAVERILQPLGRRGWVDPARTALAFGMVIRFLPVLREQWFEIQQAQAARGLQARPHALLVPMLARTLQRAQEISDCLDARGF